MAGRLRQVGAPRVLEYSRDQEHQQHRPEQEACNRPFPAVTESPHVHTVQHYPGHRSRWAR